MKADAEIEEMFRDVTTTKEGRQFLNSALRTAVSKTFVAQLIDRINALRAGRSLRHASTRAALEHYCEGLSVDEKATVLKVVKELVRVSQTDPHEVVGATRRKPQSAPRGHRR